MADLFEAFMVIGFGVSWPINIVKAWRTKTTKGTSVLFYFFIWLGYVFGILSKVIQHAEGTYAYNYVFFFYILNLTMVTAGILIYFRNRRIEKQSL